MPTIGQSAEFSRVVNTTMAKFFRKNEDNIMRKRKLTAMLQAKGRVMKNQSGDEMKWTVRYKRSPMKVIGDTVNLSYSRRTKDKTASLPWVGLAMDDALGRKEKLMNKGQEAIVRHTAVIGKRLKEDIEDQFALELYKDGYLAANSGHLYGLESFLGHAGSTGANNKTFTPNDTYAGHSTVPGTLGTWTGNWPEGDGDAQYEWWSPVIVDPTGSAWTASTKTWPNTVIEALRYGIVCAQRTTQKLDLVMHSRESYNQFLDALDSRERIVTERSASNSLLVKLGFGDVTNFEGVDQTWEQGVETEVASVGTYTLHAYGLNLSQMELCSLQDQLFVPDPIDFSAETLTDRYLVTFFGNLKANPRFQVAWESN